jgi:hypothetical protein
MQTVTSITTRMRTRTVLALLGWLAALGCCAGGLLATLLWTRPLTFGTLAPVAVPTLTLQLGLATVGLVLALRRPDNPIGWLYVATGLVWSLQALWMPWIDHLARGQQPLPLAAQLAAVLGQFLWAPAIVLGVTLPALLLPDGRLRSRRWRVVAASSVTAAAVTLLGGSLAPGPLERPPIDNPFGLAGAAGTVARVVGVIGVALLWAGLPPAAVYVVLRFRAARGVERQQLRWVAAGAAGGVVGLVLAATGGFGLLPAALEAFGFLGLLCPPVGIAVAVLRYRLWELDRLVSRTVTYALVTSLLVVPYLLIVPAVTRLAQGAGSLAVAAATLAAVAVFQPLRRRVQDAVDRRFARRRHDAARTIEAFTVRLRQQIDLDGLVDELLGVVDETMQPTQVSLWLRPTADQQAAQPTPPQAKSSRRI